FCKSLDDKLPAYSYIPLTTDEARIKVMQSRLFNEIRAGEIFGGRLCMTLMRASMSLVLRRAYFDNLDRWVFEGKAY
ncbi:MAG TPA: hypothetical protein VNN13_04990, partial [Methylomirabilota bacterium]|nr:hypothetical protein [Methylomirabilota bacterium]